MDKKSKLISGLKDGKIIIQKPNKYFSDTEKHHILVNFYSEFSLFLNHSTFKLYFIILCLVVQQGQAFDVMIGSVIKGTFSTQQLLTSHLFRGVGK